MTARPRFHGWITLALLGLTALLAAAFGGRREGLAVRPRPPEDGNVLRVACTQVMAPDPHQRHMPLAQYNQLILSLWEPLVECDPATGQPQPAAARSWAWSADRMTLTLALRPDARWSNGEPVTAADFVRGWQRLLRQMTAEAETLFPLKNAAAYHRGQLKDAGAVGVHALDDFTLQLELAAPRPTLVMELADPLLSPLYRTDEKVLAGREYFQTASALVTNGPFHLVQASADGYRLAASPWYHDLAAVHLAGVQFVRADNLAIAQLQLAAGVVDLLSPTPFGRSRTMPTVRPFTVETELEPMVTSLDFNVTRGPLQDVRVRQALALALDRSGPIQRYDPGHMVAAWAWVPDMPGRPSLKLLKEDAGEARRLLAAAGYPRGRGFPVLAMDLPLASRGDPFPQAWTECWYRELGIKTYIRYGTSTQQAAHLRAGDFDVLYNGLIATVPDAGDLLGAFLGPAEFNGSRWHDEEVTALLTRASSRSGREHLDLLDQAERRVMAAVPSVPVMFQRRQTLRADEVQGWYADPLARQSLKRLQLAAGISARPIRALE
jgi:oligopeptide transport system substrate-binding protein